MIESDAHTNQPERGLARLVAFDKLIREISTLVNPRETLLLFAADHSFDLRIRAGSSAEPLLKGWEEWDRTTPAGADRNSVRLPFLRVDNAHTGEEIVAAATGPGAARVRGFFSNTHLFQIMMDAYGWRPGSAQRVQR
jgi:alkaline phosphatase